MSPHPLTLTVCGLLLALSVIFRVAVRLSMACGVNVTEMKHLLLGAILLPQLPFCAAKSPGSAPVNVMLPMLTAVVKSLVRTTYFAILVVPTGRPAKVIKAGVRLTWSSPAAISFEVCGLLLALSETFRTADRPPVD